MSGHQLLQTFAVALRALHGFITAHDQRFKFMGALLATIFINGHGIPPNPADYTPMSRDSGSSSSPSLLSPIAAEPTPVAVITAIYTYILRNYPAPLYVVSCKARKT